MVSFPLSSFLFLPSFSVYLTSVCERMWVWAHTPRSEDNLGSVLIFHIVWNWVSLGHVFTHKASWPVNFSSLSCLPFPSPSSSRTGFQRCVFYCEGLSESSLCIRLVWQGLCTLRHLPSPRTALFCFCVQSYSEYPRCRDDFCMLCYF